MPQHSPTPLRKTMRFSTGMSEKLTMEAMGQILYPAMMMGIVSCARENRGPSSASPTGENPRRPRDAASPAETAGTANTEWQDVPP